MRILIQPPYIGGSSDQIARQAFDILRETARISFVCSGGTINNYAFVIVDPTDVPEALAALGKAGMRANPEDTDSLATGRKSTYA
jgi:hypothetical protein